MSEYIMTRKNVTKNETILNQLKMTDEILNSTVYGR